MVNARLLWVGIPVGDTTAHYRDNGSSPISTVLLSPYRLLHIEAWPLTD